MKAKVIKDKCINCALCYSLCPEVFMFDETDGKVMVRPGVNVAEHKERVKEAQMSCPTQAIEVEE